MNQTEIMSYGVDLGWKSIDQFEEDCSLLLSPIQELSKQYMLSYTMWITPYTEDSNFEAHPLLGEHSEPIFMDRDVDVVSVVVDAASETVARNDGDIRFFVGVCFYTGDYPVILNGENGIPLLISNDLQWEHISKELDEWILADTSDAPFTGYLAAHSDAPFTVY